MLSRGEGGWAGVGILIRHSCSREWLLTLWIRPRMLIFDLSLSRGRAVWPTSLEWNESMLYLILFNNKRMLASCSRINCVLVFMTILISWSWLEEWFLFFVGLATYNFLSAWFGPGGCLEWIALPLCRNIWHNSPVVGCGFLRFLTKYVVPGEWFLTKLLDKMSKSPPLPPRDNIDRCISFIYGDL